MTDADIAALIRPALEKVLGHRGLTNVEVRSGEDHDGDAALFVNLRFGVGGSLPTSGEADAAARDVDRLLLTGGDTRFAYMNYRFPDDPEGKSRFRLQLRERMQA